MKLPDVQASKPEVRINLTRVGVTNVKKLVEVARQGKRPIVLISDFKICVDLPSSIKGANLSRNFEAVYEVLEEAVSTPTYEIEELCSEVAKRLLHRHAYATTAEVSMRSEYILKRRTPVTKIQCQELANIFAEACAVRYDDGGIRVRKTIGAEVVGMTTCPCAQEMMREKVWEELEKLGIEDGRIKELLREIPLATHNQRGRGIISIEVEDDVRVSLDKIIKVIEDSMSSRVYELLKRPDEAYLVEYAHRRPMFVEDCVREMARRIVEEFKELPDNTVVSIKQVNEESIHRHDAFAERVATLGELRRELNYTRGSICENIQP
ncbi:MAG: GTP cyclohydrolase FolE2 [Candidatus Alkanophagales archaeon MCA70_species_2]|nr:GTP cyclohydrolase FolE2 [Candidatus Alkanophaga liquidiphilum]